MKVSWAEDRPAVTHYNAIYTARNNVTQLREREGPERKVDVHILRDVSRNENWNYHFFWGGDFMVYCTLGDSCTVTGKNKLVSVYNV